MKKRTPILMILLIPVTILLLAAAWAFFVEPSLLTVTNIEIADKRLPAGMDGLRAVFFSDLHAGACFSEAEAERVAARIKELKPDLLLFGGDWTQWDGPAFKTDGRRVAAAFAAVKPRFGKFAVLGNHDEWPAEVRPLALEMLSGAGFTVLENRAVTVAEGFIVAGTRPWPLHMGHTGGIGKDAVTWAALHGRFSILLAHEPAQINDFKGVPFALQLSGHTHGGQVALPFIGPLASTYATEGYNAGWYTVNGIPMYVTRGVGVIETHVRFFAPPEIVVITFHRK